MKNAGEGVDKGKLSYTAGRNVNYHNDCGGQCSTSSKTRNRATI